MKKCPNCQKEFPDTMRFCQTDGTPLVDGVEESQPEDPLKTTVVRQEDIASSIPPADPYKTIVASSSGREDSGDLLQLPEEEFDPLKTMVAPPVGQDRPILEDPKPEAPKFEEIKEEIKFETPASSPFGGFSQPNDPLPEASKDYYQDPTLAQPEPPKFSEPDLSPPSFGDLSPKQEVEEDLPQTVMQNPWDSPPKSEQSPFSSDSPFAKPSETPVSSPFDAPKSPFEAPPSPFSEAPKSPFEASSEPSFNQPPQSFNPPPPSLEQTQHAPFNPPPPSFQEPPANQFGAQFDQMNQGFGGNQPLQASDWTPPPSPEQGWQDQGLGTNTPFQPPVAMQGQNQTLPIVSLVFGILSVCCYISPLTGIVALVTGYMGMKNVNTDPMQYGGKGLAIAGMITGGVFFLMGLAYWLYIIFVIGFVGLSTLGR